MNKEVNKFWFKELFQFGTFDDIVAKCNAHGVDIKTPYKSGINQDLVVLDYNQIESKGSDFFARLCRGLVLNKQDLSVVSRPFTRFFNYGEQRTDLLIKSVLAKGGHDVRIYDKLDGSIIKLFFNPLTNLWHVGTRAGKGEHPITDTVSYLDMFATIVSGEVNNIPHVNDEARSMQILQEFVREENLDKSVTYLFELCTPYNANVVKYDTCVLSFLGANHNNLNIEKLKVFDIAKVFEQGKEEDQCQIQYDILLNTIESGGASFNWTFKNQYISYPVSYEMNGSDINEVLNVVNMMKGREQEGFVVYVDGVPIIKMKNEEYLILHHHLSSKTFTAKDATNIVLIGEEAEYLAICPERAELIQPYIEARDKALDVSNQFYDIVLDFIIELNKKNNDPLNWQKPKDLHHLPNVLNNLSREDKKTLFVSLGEIKQHSGALWEKIPKDLQPFVTESVINVVTSMLSGVRYHEVLLNKFTEKSRVHHLVLMMKAMGKNFTDYEKRTSSSKETMSF